jgi:FSR family fosmidomycin resistance protein-like MFS transporter
MWISLLMGAVGLIRSYPGLVLLVGVGSLGSAAFHPPAATIAAASNSAKRGAAVSVFSVGGSIGAALSPLGITMAMRWLGASGTLMLVPIGILAGAFLFHRLGSGASDRQQQGVQRAWPDGRALAGIVLVVLAVMSLAWFLVTLRTYLPVWVLGQGQSAQAGARLLAVLLAGQGVGSLLGGTLSDRLGRWQVYALCLGLLGPVLLLFLGSAGILQAVLVAMAGVLIGATFPLSIVMAQEAWPGGVGIASGLVMGLGWVPGGIGASVTGLIADRLSLGTGLRLLVIPALLGMVCMLFYALLQRSTVGRVHEPLAEEVDVRSG